MIESIVLVCRWIAFMLLVPDDQGGDKSKRKLMLEPLRKAELKHLSQGMRWGNKNKFLPTI